MNDYSTVFKTEEQLIRISLGEYVAMRDALMKLGELKEQIESLINEDQSYLIGVMVQTALGIEDRKENA